MHKDVVSSFRLDIFKIYGIVYTLVAAPMAYYGIAYVELISKHTGTVLPLLALTMAITLSVSFAVQRRSHRALFPFLRGAKSASFDGKALKRVAYRYPGNLVGVMTFCWIALLDIVAFGPLMLIYSGSMTDFLVINVLLMSCALMSIPMTYFIAERSTARFLSLPEVRALEEPEDVPRLSLTAKVMAICLIIILTLLLNVTAAVILSVVYGLGQTEIAVNLLVIGVQGVIATAVISILFARSIKLPIANMRGCTELVRDGDLRDTVPVLSRDELGDASESFNVFVKRLSASVRDIKKGVSDTGSNVVDLARAMGNTGSSVSEIHLISREVQDAVTSQASIIEEVSRTVSEISGIIDRQDGRIQEQVGSVSESSSAIEEMIASIRSIAGNLAKSSVEAEGLSRAVRTGSGNIAELKQTVRVLDEQSDSVFQANSIIKNISAQTNLLAMNAAIEAAHAGEAGSGFAVVADEIRKLAESSNIQSKLITESLKSLKTAIDKAVRAADQAERSFGDITGSVQAVSGLETEIKHSVDEQSSASAQILQSLSGINAITADVKEGSSKMLSGSRAIQERVTRLVELTERVKKAALEVVEKAGDVKSNADESLELLALCAEYSKRIEELVEFFKVS